MCNLIEKLTNIVQIENTMNYKKKWKNLKTRNERIHKWYEHKAKIHYLELEINLRNELIGFLLKKWILRILGYQQKPVLLKKKNMNKKHHQQREAVKYKSDSTKVIWRGLEN